MYRSTLRLPLVALVATLAAPTLLHAQPTGLDPESAMHYSLYYENFKNKNYADALPDLRWILDNDPGFHRKRDTNFDRGVELFEGLAEAEEDPAKKREWLAEGLSLFDRAVPAIQEIGGDIDEFEWARDKGRYIQKHLDHLDGHKDEAIEAYRQAYQLDPVGLDPYYLDVLVGALYASGDLGATLDFLRELQDTRGEEQGVEALVHKYFDVIPPDEQIAFLEEQLAANPEDMEVILQLYDLYDQEGYHSERMQLAPKILMADPSPHTLSELTRLYLEDGDIVGAVAIFEQLSALPGVELKAHDFHNMGIAQQELENFDAARDYYRLALEVDAGFNTALRAIAGLYATAAARCGIQDREQSAVFWLIADAYSRAGDGAGAARMSTAFPTAEDVFYVQAWTNGAPTEVSYSCRGLTISGTTTVRQR